MNLVEKRRAGKYNVRIPLPLFNLNTGNYRIKFLMGIINTQLFDSVELSFSIEHNNFTKAGIRPGLLIALNKWEYI
ncbi:MAG: hypothetical protein EOP48_18785 [Sphingobacteriales bacterium]|nr:MAG: hypothetical protein EOP48_18785 [Sphingobacteriales bacterium]